MIIGVHWLSYLMLLPTGLLLQPAWELHSDDSSISTKMMNTISEAVSLSCASKTIEERRKLPMA